MLDQFPINILNHILAELDQVDINHILIACKAWYNIDYIKWFYRELYTWCKTETSLVFLPKHYIINTNAGRKLIKSTGITVTNTTIVETYNIIDYYSDLIKLVCKKGTNTFNVVDKSEAAKPLTNIIILHNILFPKLTRYVINLSGSLYNPPVSIKSGHWSGEAETVVLGTDFVYFIHKIPLGCKIRYYILDQTNLNINPDVSFKKKSGMLFTFVEKKKK